jgi:Domain of unknown function (DUF427)
MADKAMKIPGPDHPISIEANPSRIVIKVGTVIADTRDALTLREASYSPVQCIPRRDVDMAALTRIGGVKCTFDHGGNWQPGNMTVSAQRKRADRREFVRSQAAVYVEGE